LWTPRPRRWWAKLERKGGREGGREGREGRSKMATILFFQHRKRKMKRKGDARFYKPTKQPTNQTSKRGTRAAAAAAAAVQARTDLEESQSVALKERETTTPTRTTTTTTTTTTSLGAQALASSFL